MKRGLLSAVGVGAVAALVAAPALAQSGYSVQTTKVTEHSGAPTSQELQAMRSNLQQEINRTRSTGGDVTDAVTLESKADGALSQDHRLQAQQYYEQARAALPHDTLRSSAGGRSADSTGGSTTATDPGAAATNPEGSRGP